MYSMRKPQIGMANAAPSDDAIILAMNFERSTGGIHTAVIGCIAGHEAPIKTKIHTKIVQLAQISRICE